MTTGFPIPLDVRGWLRGTFASLNAYVSNKLSRIPTLHETSLDMSFVEFLSLVAAPFRLPSDWIVRLDVHYLGGMRHWGRWEIADIGVLVMLRRGTLIERSKIGLLQSKRLYPAEQGYEEDAPIDYMQGFGRLWEPDSTFAKVIAARDFSFSQKCRYKALVVDDTQYNAIKEYEYQYEIPVYYNLYHPLQIPLRQTFPIVPTPRRRTRKNIVGCRVVPSVALRHALRKQAKGYAPSYGDLRYLLDAPFNEPLLQAGWRLEDFIDELLDCRAGYIANDEADEGVRRIFSERGAPISAAIAISISAPG